MRKVFFLLTIAMLCFTTETQAFTDTSQDVTITQSDGHQMVILDVITAVPVRMVTVPQSVVISTNDSVPVDVGKQLARVNYKLKNITTKHFVNRELFRLKQRTSTNRC